MSESANTTVMHPITAAAGVIAPGHVGELTQYLPFELVNDVLAQTKTVQRRLWDLPSRVGLYFVLVRGVLPRAVGSAVDTGGDVSTVDVFEVPVPAGVRIAVPGGVGLDHVAAVLPDWDRPAGAAPDHVDEVDYPVQVGRDRWVKIRVDTTVVPANVAYPTDSGLLAKAVTRIAKTARRIQAAGGAVPTTLRDRSRAAGRRAHDLNAKLRTRNAAAKEEALAVVRRKNAELADVAVTAVGEADRLLANAKRALRTAKKKAAARHPAGYPRTRTKTGRINPQQDQPDEPSFQAEVAELSYIRSATNRSRETFAVRRSAVKCSTHYVGDSPPIASCRRCEARRAAPWHGGEPSRLAGTM